MTSFLVVVPTLDSYISLPRLVESLVSQTYNDWRVIFIDGKSSLLHREWLDNLCRSDSRFGWEKEVNMGNSIFGAMNQGITHAKENEWLLFWGSDDMAANNHMFAHIASRIKDLNKNIDLYICSGRYYSLRQRENQEANIEFHRLSRFVTQGSFRESLFWGSTPPHQATIFSPHSLQLLSSYDETFKLTADLDYFLRLSKHGGVDVEVDEFLLVNIGSGGVSSRESRRRIKEVMRSYQRAFGYRWMVPFVMRYYKRLTSILKTV